MRLLLKGNVRRQFKAILHVHGKAKLVKGQKTLTFSTTQEEPPKKKGKSDNGENLDTSCSVVQAKESANRANILDIRSISKGENSSKSSIVINGNIE